jgi:separase
MHGGDVVTPPTATRELLNALSAAEKFFWLCLELPRSIVGISFVREASISLSLIRAFQTALGAKSKNSATVSASLIGESIGCLYGRFVLTVKLSILQTCRSSLP